MNIIVKVTFKLRGNLLESFASYIRGDYSNLVFFFDLYLYVEVDVELEELELEFSSFSIEVIRYSYLNLNSLGMLLRARCFYICVTYLKSV